MTGFKSVLVGFLLAIAIIVFGHFVLHIPQGAGRLGLALLAAAVFFVFAFGPGTLWAKVPAYDTEEAAGKGLKVNLYPGKWNVAKMRVQEQQPYLAGTRYWLAVRTMYLELGGE